MWIAGPEVGLATGAPPDGVLVTADNVNVSIFTVEHSLVVNHYKDISCLYAFRTVSGLIHDVLTYGDIAIATATGIAMTNRARHV
jgi:hypothetical protein